MDGLHNNSKTLTWTYGIASDAILHIVSSNGFGESNDCSLGGTIRTSRLCTLYAGGYRSHIDNVTSNLILFPLSE